MPYDPNKSKHSQTGAPAMDTAVHEIRAEDINPRFNWGRALPALGTMGVDFEERVDYRRLHRYRLSRGKQALGNSEPRAPGSRSCGTSARPPCTTSSTRRGSRRRTARPA